MTFYSFGPTIDDLPEPIVYTWAPAKYQAVRCPVCEGSGQYTDYGTYGQVTSIAPVARSCHGCSGKGWVEVKAA